MISSGEEPIRLPDATLDAPSSITVNQRSTKALPGSDGRVLITLGDITRGQVQVSLSEHQGPSLVGARSMRTGDDLVLEIGEHSYQIQLTRLDNQLLGQDRAFFSILPRIPGRMAGSSSAEEFGRLIRGLAEPEGAVFLRNGKEYSADQAIEHLERKLDIVVELTTPDTPLPSAEALIAGIGSESSASGDPYLIRLRDGSEIELQDWFFDRLRELRAEPHPSAE